MKRSSKAALLSGLIFPGIGHIVLKQYLRGTALMLFALVALSVIVTRIYQRALTIVDGINSGNVPVDAGAIAEMVSNSTSGTESFIENIAVIALGACWLIGIIDSYRVGVAQEK
ncbi:MAG: TM2 domain-containing membrane protein YozV [Woeseiaceae bacterium]|jgi:TM2 domain-containing membrane protein YozV